MSCSASSPRAVVSFGSQNRAERWCASPNRTLMWNRHAGGASSKAATSWTWLAVRRSRNRPRVPGKSTSPVPPFTCRSGNPRSAHSTSTPASTSLASPSCWFGPAGNQSRRGAVSGGRPALTCIIEPREPPVRRASAGSHRTDEDAGTSGTSNGRSRVGRQANWRPPDHASSVASCQNSRRKVCRKASVCVVSRRRMNPPPTQSLASVPQWTAETGTSGSRRINTRGA